MGLAAIGPVATGVGEFGTMTSLVTVASDMLLKQGSAVRTGTWYATASGRS